MWKITISILFITLALCVLNVQSNQCTNTCIGVSNCIPVPSNCREIGGAVENYPECACCPSCVYRVGTELFIYTYTELIISYVFINTILDDGEYCGYNSTVNALQVCECGSKCTNLKDGGVCVQDSESDCDSSSSYSSFSSESESDSDTSSDSNTN